MWGGKKAADEGEGGKRGREWINYDCISRIIRQWQEEKRGKKSLHKKTKLVVFMSLVFFFF